MDYSLRAQLNQTIRMSTAQTADIYGEASVTASTLHQARVEEHARMYERSDGEVVRTSHMIILDNDVSTPTYAGYIWMPGTSSSTLTADARHPKVIRYCPAEDGTCDHWEVLV